jgi:hypothetical protein
LHVGIIRPAASRPFSSRHTAACQDPTQPQLSSPACLRFEKEHAEREKLQQQHQAAAQQPEAAAGPYAGRPPRVRLPGPRSPPAPGSPRQGAAAARRHTSPALLPSPGMLDHLHSTASRLEELRRELERDMAAGRPPDGSIALSRLSSMLHACSFLRDASAAACAGGSPGDGADGDGRCAAGAAADGGSPPCGDGGGEGEQEVALHDDGAAGVGATAAAAVSVALAQSWAAAAGARQAAVRAAAAAEGAVRPGKACFKLVAAVPRGYRPQRDKGPGVRSRCAHAVVAPAHLRWPCARRATLSLGDLANPHHAHLP